VLSSGCSKKRDASWARLGEPANAKRRWNCDIGYRLHEDRQSAGRELRLSKPSLVVTYVAFAGGLALASLLLPEARR